MTLGQRIRDARKKVRLTQTDVALRCDVSVATVSRWEGGQRTPKMDSLRALAKALGVTMASLVRGIDS